MKIRLNPNRWRRGIVLWVLILVFVIFVVIVAGIAWAMIKALQKIVPPPPPPDNVYPVPGDPYGGGITIGYGPPPEGSSLYRPEEEAPKDTTASTNKTFYIFAGDWPTADSMTNLIWSGSYDDLTNQFNSNGIPIEKFTNGTPPHRFYNIMRDQ